MFGEEEMKLNKLEWKKTNYLRRK